MSADDAARLIAWEAELIEAHRRFREALRAAQRAAADDDREALRRDLLLYCHGFCVALDSHHSGEDALLFPALRAQHPELDSTIDKLAQDHSMIAHLLTQLDHAVQTDASADTLALHLDSIAAIMESHFRFEERALRPALARLALSADRAQVFGPL